MTTCPVPHHPHQGIYVCPVATRGYLCFNWCLNCHAAKLDVWCNRGEAKCYRFEHSPIALTLVRLSNHSCYCSLLSPEMHMHVVQRGCTLHFLKFLVEPQPRFIISLFYCDSHFPRESWSVFFSTQLFLISAFYFTPAEATSSLRISCHPQIYQILLVTRVRRKWKRWTRWRT